MCGNFVHNLHSLFLRRVVNTSLEHTTPMSMSGHLDTVLTNSVENELILVTSESIEAFLNDMIAV